MTLCERGICPTCRLFGATMKKEFVRNPYNYDSDAVSDETGLKCEDESLTEQEHLAETDINYIADKFLKTGHAPQVVNMPTYGDFSGIADFQSAMNIITRAKQEFMDLPAKIRTRFSNDPAELIKFLDDPQNRDEAEKLGLVEKRDTIDTPPTTGDNDGTGDRPGPQGKPQKPPRAARTEGPKAEDAGSQGT